MFSGSKGVQYGLQLRGKPGKSKPAPAPAAKRLAAFGDQEDSDGEGGGNANFDRSSVNSRIAQAAAEKAADPKVHALHQEALAADATIFDYDAHYDAMQEQKVRPALKEKLQRKSKYIESLKDKAKEREREQNIVYERKLTRERQVEDHLFGDKEKFVTGAYRNKLEEDKKWLAEEAKREAEEAQNDVVKKGHMHDFYRNMFKNSSVRSSLREEAEEHATASRAPAEAAQQPQQHRAPPAPAAAEAEPAATPQQAGPHISKSDADWEAARAARERFEQAQEDQAAEVERDSVPAAAAPAQEAAEEQVPAVGQQGEPEPSAKPLSKEEKIAAARERLQQRKRQRVS